MNSGGGGGKPQTITSDVPSWQKPHWQNYLNQASSTAANYNDVYSGQRYAGLNNMQRGAINSQVQTIGRGNPMMDAANQTLTKTASGGFLGANPYIDAQVGRAQGSVVDAYNNVTRPQIDAQGARSGSFGNSGVESLRTRSQSDLQRNLGDVATQMYGDNYGRERGYQMQAIGMAPAMSQARFADDERLMGLGGLMQADQQGQINADMQAFSDRANLGVDRLGILGQALGQQRGSSQTTPVQGPNYANGILGGAMAGSALGPWGMAGGALLGLMGSR